MDQVFCFYVVSIDGNICQNFTKIEIDKND